MNKITSVRLLMAVIAAGLSCNTAAADTIPVPAGIRTFEMLPLISPWMGTSNPAALSACNVGNLSLAQAGFMYKNDEIRLMQQPELTTSYDAATKGFMKIGKLSLFGSFGYSNTCFNGLKYNGTMMFNTLNPYLLGDTVSARQFKEQFEMEGKVSYSVNDRITVAAGVEYLSVVGAKQTDPRNKNTISSLRVTPGIIYNLGKTIVGLSGSVYTTSDEISYSVEGNWNQNLFVFLGLGYYRPEPNISYYSQWYTGKGYSGALQASHNSDDILVLAELSYDHFAEEARTGSSFRLIDGITETNQIALSGLLRINRGEAFHLISLKGSLKSLSSDEILQRSYTINKGNYSYDSLATVSWINNKHMISDIRAEARYSYLVLDSDRNIDIEAGGGVAVNFFSTEHFPVKSYGFYNTFNITGSLFARKLFRAGNLNITPGIDASYRMNLSSDISYIIQPLSIPEMVYHDYFVSKANVISGVLSVRLEMPVSKNKFVKSVFFVPQGSWAAAPGSEAGDITGYMISAVAGLTF